MKTVLRNSYSPKIGDYCDTLVVDLEKNNKYLFDCDGVWTAVSGGITPEVEEAIAEAKAEANDYTDTEVGIEKDAREAADADIWTEIEAIEAASDVVDVVGTYAELEAYDTSKLKDNDLIKVLADETRDDAITYYRWSTTTETFTYVGAEGPYYTASETDTLLDGKQDTLIAGTNIQIAADGKTISATDTTYTHFTGATTSADGTAGLVPAPTAGDQNKVLKGDGTWQDEEASVTVFYGANLWGTSETLYKDPNMTQAATFKEIYDSFGANKIVKVKYSDDEDCMDYEGIMVPAHENLDCGTSINDGDVDYITVLHDRGEPIGPSTGLEIMRLIPNKTVANYPNVQSSFNVESAVAQRATRNLSLRPESQSVSDYVLRDGSYQGSILTHSQVINGIGNGRIYSTIDDTQNIFHASSSVGRIVYYNDDRTIVYAKKNATTNAIEFWKLTPYASPDTTHWNVELISTTAAFTGATSSVAGSAGMVPAPTTADPDKFLKGDGTWSTIPNGGEQVFYIDRYIQGESTTVNFYSDDTLTTAVEYGDIAIAAKNGGAALVTPIGSGQYLSGETDYFRIVFACGDEDGDPVEPNITIINADNIYTANGDKYDTHATFYRKKMRGATSNVAGRGGSVPQPAAGDNDKYLKGDGTWGTPTNTTYSPFVGASASTDGSSGLVPMPFIADKDKYLKGDGTWATVQAGPTVVQTTGQSTTDVMSQKAVTDIIGDIESALQILNSGAGVP